MRERPILFSGPMVRAILEGRKTVTRRVVKPAPVAVDAPPPAIAGGHWEWKGKRLAGQKDEFLAQCPYGQPGDRLWVREAWSTHSAFDSIPPRDLTTRSIAYLADGEVRTGKYRPPMFMPRWASRILLEITDVRVERLQSISEEQAEAEGCAPAWLDADDNETVHFAAQPTYRQGFARLWRDINGAGSWEANPWVWAISFRRIQP